MIFVNIPFKKKIKRKQCFLTNNSKREHNDIRPTNIEIGYKNKRQSIYLVLSA